MKPETMPDNEAAAVVVAMPLGDLADATPDESIGLESCSEHEWIIVRTLGSLYDVVVLSGTAGEVMVRGGRFFPEFRRATVQGSSFGGSAVKLGCICVGLQLELHVDGKFFVTSPIQAVSRHRVRVPDTQA